MVTDTQVKTGYKETDIGSVPVEWGLCKLGDECELITKGTTPTSLGKSYTVDGINFIKIESLDKNGKILPDHVEHIDEDTDKLLTRSRLKQNDILVSIAGALGRVALVEKSILPANTNQALAIARLKKDSKLNNRYVFYFLKSNAIQNHISSISVQGAQANLSLQNINDLPIAFPNTSKEQIEISKAIQEIDELLSKLDQLIEKKRNIKQGTMQELLTGKRGLPGFSGEWEEMQIKDLADIVSGGTPKTSVEEYWDGDIFWCTPTDITNCEPKWISSTEKTISKIGLQKSSANMLPKGSLLLCSRATIGEVRITTTEITTNQGFKSLVCNSNTDNEFLYYYILTIKNKLIEKANGSTFLEISKKDIQNITLLVPKKEEQRAIAGILSAMDEEIMELENQKNKYLDVKQGMMQQLLTGRIRLV